MVNIIMGIIVLLVSPADELSGYCLIIARIQYSSVSLIIIEVPISILFSGSDSMSK